MSAHPARQASQFTGVHVQYISSREAASAKGPFTLYEFRVVRGSTSGAMVARRFSDFKLLSKKLSQCASESGLHPPPKMDSKIKSAPGLRSRFHADFVAKRGDLLQGYLRSLLKALPEPEVAPTTARGVARAAMRSMVDDFLQPNHRDVGWDGRQWSDSVETDPSKVGLGQQSDAELHDSLRSLSLQQSWSRPASDDEDDGGANGDGAAASSSAPDWIHLSMTVDEEGHVAVVWRVEALETTPPPPLRPAASALGDASAAASVPRFRMSSMIDEGAARQAVARTGGAPPPASASASAPGAPPPLWARAAGEDFVDGSGRRVTLRGLNVGGTSKMPTTPCGYTHGDADEFFDTAASCSFVGRPFPLAEADVHLTRLRAYGCNVMRLIVTWEAVEHAGPGVYDDAYISYVAQLCARAAEYGMHVCVDPHQDVWSRFSGGDGAPAWTFAEVGLDVRAFHATGAALVHQTFGGHSGAAAATPVDGASGGSSGASSGASGGSSGASGGSGSGSSEGGSGAGAGTAEGDKGAFPRMCWPTNLHKLACGTMFTLFWGGDIFAPRTTVRGEPVQRFLQRHYIGAMARLAAALRDCPNVLGFGTMNEPLPGFIGVKHLDKLSGPLRNGTMPTPFEGMLLGGGFRRTVGVYALDSLKSLAAGLPASTTVANDGCASAWLPGFSCVWRQHGVWGVDAATGQPKLHKPSYFARRRFGEDFYLPFAQRFDEAVRAAGHRDWMLFVELPPADLGLCEFPKLGNAPGDGANANPLAGARVVHAPHWYDQLTLFLGKFVPSFSLDVASGRPALGKAAVKKMQARQLAEHKAQAVTHLGGVPTLIGEVGVPFDMHHREAYTHFQLANCEAALRNSVDAMEANGLSYTLWCYTPDHTEQWGDGWNREDLSVYSASAPQHAQSGRLCEAMAGHHGLRRLHLTARGCPPHA